MFSYTRKRSGYSVFLLTLLFFSLFINVFSNNVISAEHRSHADKNKIESVDVPNEEKSDSGINHERTKKSDETLNANTSRTIVNNIQIVSHILSWLTTLMP
ncbi:hypothetical protein [Xenorhabdus szentirmaii]|uniref:Uncharacterized protein n=1 Tax=Xenorhabdus szentirmaii DSM 16338 TaxID=1427518 RepID=W1IVG5_9GAMM|nr:MULTISPECIES: hypothetical protein [Xenorhabdus]MBD2780677.1 hypothetical protein [Xenorhabdus sp. 38]MBD2820757.1 hypothetical protein [Xenorhabdus sp. 42]PHM32877.1 inverse autotransporter beta-barrel domain-containing protein [Xenorhabdus szentirmaii DSM 16338]PHM40804.1 inverse autotransporter beta-barrel domain-containing protein [Xenorhabdus szentirmaii]CDL81828.1 exported hypothetical protein [Xenorhabdus szentirmaii DSM 16338]